MRPVADPPVPAELRAAEAWLVGRELFGIRPGLERMVRLLAALGDPQDAVPTVHVVGSNGKTSTTTIAGDLLRARGLRVGGFVSPHLVSFRERVLLDGVPCAAGPYAAAVGRVREAALALEAADAGAEARVTQFEAVTAAAFLLMAEAGIDAAVVEAGLGGRFDATNVLPRTSPAGRPAVAVLTGVSLEHTQWLGADVQAIAAEKVAVLRRGGVLVLGPGLPPEAEAVARAHAADVGARVLAAPDDPGPAVSTPGAPPFQRRNLATAATAVAAFLGDEVDAPAADRALRDVGPRIAVPGRFEVVGRAPLTLRDGAHNPAGAEALAEALADAAPPGPIVGVLAVRADKDTTGLLRAIAPSLDHVVATQLGDGRGLDAATLAAEARRAAPSIAVHEHADARGALARARDLAGPGGTVVLTGSLHLLAEIARPVDDRGPVAGF